MNVQESLDLLYPYEVQSACNKQQNHKTTKRIGADSKDLQSPKWQQLVAEVPSCICQPKHKVVLFLDDLQWIDPASLDLLELVLLEEGLKGSLLVIGSYRDNEVDENHPVQQRLTSIQKSRGQRMKRIWMDNLTQQDTQELISDLLNAEPSATQELAEIAHNKVNGNPFFLIQLLIALQEEGHLFYNVGTAQWEWDVTKIRKSIVVSSNVLTVLMEKMKRLDGNARRILAITSRLGSSFDGKLVNLIANELADSPLLPTAETKEDASATLESLVDTGFLEVVFHHPENKTYCFVHDQILLAAISFQDEEKLSELCLEMARVLYFKRSDFDFESMFFAIVDLYNQGRQTLVKSSKEVSILIDLNHKAGRSALESSAFSASIRYLRTAIDLIPPQDRFGKHYKTFLEIQNTLIKAEYSLGEWNELNHDVNIIINAKEVPILDKITAYSLTITELVVRQNKHDEAIDLTVDVLGELGIVFRRGLGKLAVVAGLLKTKRLLKRIPMASILEKGELDDPHKIVALDLLTAVNSSLFAADTNLLMVSVLRTLRWSLKYGFCKHTCRSLGTFAMVDFALGNVSSAVETCRLSLQLAKQQNLLETQYAPITSAYGFVIPWKEPMSACAKQLLRGYEIGLEIGDLYFGMTSIVIYGFFCFSMGKPLSSLEADLGDYAKQMQDCNMELQRNFLCLTWQLVLNLLGHCDDPLSLNGKAMSEEKMIASAGNNPPLRAQFYCHKLQLCVYFEDFERGATLLSETKKIAKVNPAHTIIWRTALFEGIIAFELLMRGIKKYQAVAKRALGNLEKYVSDGNVNCVHLLYLLQAEKEATNGNLENARPLYDKAIAAAARSGFVNDRALASERCARMLMREEDEYRAKNYFEQAKEAYTQIEAYGKVDHMLETNRLLKPRIYLDGMEQSSETKAPAETTSSTLECESFSHGIKPSDL